MKYYLLVILLICTLWLSACSQPLSTYEVVTLRSAADGAENAAQETEREVTKIKAINQTLEHSTKAE